MNDLAITRASYLHLYLDVLREIGVPVDRALERSSLPTWIEMSPDDYVSVPVAIDWIARNGHDLPLMELGLRAGRGVSLATFDATFRSLLLDAPTGQARMHTFLRAAALEDNSLTIRLLPDGAHVRIVCDSLRFDSSQEGCLNEWMIVQSMVVVMRSIAGSQWCPVEITFFAPSPPGKAVLDACADTRILTGRPHTSILVEAADLARACLERIQHPACPAEADCAWSFARALRAIIRPYLGEGYPSIDQMAEIVGLSPRTLQRRLQDCGRKYSDLVAEARIETARELMADSSLRITDIALAVGYDNPQHLSRLFRRITGLTPRAYRQAIVA